MPEQQRLGRYLLGDKIGEGGMGVVHRAVAEGAEGFAKTVAIKTIHDSLARDPGIREMFVTEARTAQRLHHGNIVQIIDVGLADDLPFLVIEYVDGASLADLLRTRSAPVPVADALYIAEHVISALAYAHGLTDPAGRPEGIVHRDVTPRNILLSRDGLVKLADFGIAKALAAPSYTVPGTFKGSLGYLAPEQARGTAVDARADQFAAGIVLHEMLAGKHPIAARDLEGYLAALDRGVPALPVGDTIDAGLAAIVARATAIDPAARYASMHELRAELEAWRVTHKLPSSNESLRDLLRDLVGDARTVPSRALGDVLGSRLGHTPATQQQSPRAFARRRRWLAPAIVVGALAAVGIGYALWPRSAGSQPALVDAMVVDVPVDQRDATPDVDARDAAVDAAVIDAAIRIAPPRKLGRLAVNVVPYADVYLDGTLLRRPVNVEVVAGTHQLVLHNPDTGQRVQKAIRIEPGQTLQVTEW